MSVKILQGDVRDQLATLPDQSVHCVVTSPPYWGLRDYGVAGQIGLEATPAEYVETMVQVFHEVRRALRDDGTLWLNLGDSYCAPNGRSSSGGVYSRGPNSVLKGMHHAQEVGVKRSFGAAKTKDLLGIPWRVAFALQADGWYLRQDIIWHKPNPMPESVRDRCTKAHEYIFLLSKSEKYYFDFDAIQEPCSENTNPRRAGNGYKTPDGWDTSKGDGGHGSFHKKGREAGQTGYQAKSWNGSQFHTGKTGQHQLGRAQKDRKFDPAAGNKNNQSFDDAMAVMPETRNKRSVWTVPTAPFKEAHFATFPPALIEPCILAGSPRGGGSTRPIWRRRNDRAGRGAPRQKCNPDRTQPRVRRHGA